jgi:hypothetical protein
MCLFQGLSAVLACAAAASAALAVCACGCLCPLLRRVVCSRAHSWASGSCVAVRCSLVCVSYAHEVCVWHCMSLLGCARGAHCVYVCYCVR